MSEVLYLWNPATHEEKALPFTDEFGEVDMGLVARAAALLSPKGLGGVKVNIPADALPEIKARIAELYEQKGFGDRIPAHISGREVKEEQSDLVSELKIREIKQGGIEGLLISGKMSSMRDDHYLDRVWPTPEIKEGVAKYMKAPAVLFRHGLDPELRYTVIGECLSYEIKESGIHVIDFIPKPSDTASRRHKEVYKEIKEGKHGGFSVGGYFYRDTGINKPPGMLVGWDIDEHSITGRPADGGALIDGLYEVKEADDVTAMVMQAFMTYKQTLAMRPEAVAEISRRLEYIEEMVEGIEDVLMTIPGYAENVPPDIQEDEAEEKEKKESKVADKDTQNGVVISAEELTAMQEVVKAYQAEKALREQKEREAEINEKARLAAEAQAKQIREQKETEERLFNEAVQRNLQSILGKTNYPAIGGQLTSPLQGQQGRAPSGMRGMSGYAIELKERFDVDGTKLPGTMIEWLLEAKQTGRGFKSADREVKTVSSGIPGVTVSPNGSSGGYALPVTYLQDIIPLLVDPGSIRSIAQVLPAESIVIESPKMSIAPTRASVVAENTTKPQQNIGTDLVEIRMYMLPMIIDIPNQTLRFAPTTAETMIRNNLAASIRLSEFHMVLRGTGTGEPYGLIPGLLAANTAEPSAGFRIQRGTGNNPMGGAVPAGEQLFDCVARAINVTEDRFYYPTALVVHNDLFWLMTTIKDKNDRYLLDYSGVGAMANSVWGIPVIKTTQIPRAYGVLGDFKECRLYIAQDLTVDMSSEAGTRWDKNVTGFRAEEMIGFRADQNIRAFTLIDLSADGYATT